MQFLASESAVHHTVAGERQNPDGACRATGSWIPASGQTPRHRHRTMLWPIPESPLELDRTVTRVRPAQG